MGSGSIHHLSITQLYSFHKLTNMPLVIMDDLQYDDRSQNTKIVLMWKSRNLQSTIIKMLKKLYNNIVVS